MARTNVNRGGIIRRVLSLIDMLSMFRHPKDLGEICDLLNERIGERHERRTIRRDLQAMEQQGLVIATTANGRTSWKIDLSRTEQHQRAAIQLDAQEAHSDG